MTPPPGEVARRLPTAGGGEMFDVLVSVSKIDKYSVIIPILMHTCIIMLMTVISDNRNTKKLAVLDCSFLATCTCR